MHLNIERTTIDKGENEVKNDYIFIISKIRLVWLLPMFANFMAPNTQPAQRNPFQPILNIPSMQRYDMKFKAKKKLAKLAKRSNYTTAYHWKWNRSLVKLNRIAFSCNLLKQHKVEGSLGRLSSGWNHLSINVHVSPSLLFLACTNTLIG